jgi:RNA polymerase sigma factor (sigma-70 family)
VTHDYKQTSESDLLTEYVRQRSEAAFTELVRRHLPMVQSVCRRVLDDNHAAQDAAQAVFLALARKAGTLGSERALGGWLHHVALCTARNERTARARRLLREQEAAMMQEADSQNLTPETESALREWLDRELDALPAKYRRPLVMVYLEGQSLAETAAALKCKDVTLRSWLNRAREKLRSRLVRRGVSVSVPALVAWLVSSADAAAAAVPPDLGAAMAKGAMVWTAGGAAAAGISANVVAMAKGAIQTMFISKLKTAAVVTIAAAVVSTASALSWQKVYEARDKGLPKTAIEELKPIIVDALQNKKYAEAIKAVCTKIALEGRIEGNKAEEKITRLEAEIEKAPAEMKPVMEAILANWYWHYFQQNRWRFQQRTATAAPPGKDFTTWDLPRILAEIDKHFTAALAGEKVLKATPIEQFSDLLEKGTVPDAYRPTLFDFLAHEALAFYQAGEQGAAKAEDEFEIAAASPVFAPVGEFLKWQPATTDADSREIKAINIFQNLLAFHQGDTNKTAFIDADLWRLEFGKNQAVGPELNDTYKAALKRFTDEWADHEISARALFAWATVLQSENELVEAYKLAQRGSGAHPKSYGGTQCYNLVQQIEARQVSISTERIWNEPWPVVAVNYKNLTNAYFRAVPCDFNAFVARQRWGYARLLGGLDSNEREKFIAELLAAKPAAEWSAVLPGTPDFRQRTEKVDVAKDLKPGFYVIFASHDASFGKDNNQVSATTVWVSDLALVVRQRYSEGLLDGFVLKALTGVPVAEATVRSWTRTNDGKLVTGPETKTDTNGMFRFTGENKQLLLLAQSGDQAVASDNEFSLGRANAPPPPSQNTVFFTDRSLYRPGQTIQYKGICYSVNTEGNNYKTLASQTLTVIFRDSNGKEVAKQQQKCNDYGAFSGSFTAPGGTVAGQMSLRVQDGPNGYASFNVEEYKRPKFQVELARPKEAAKLGEEITVPGKATAYTGAAIGGAKVQWRVVRNVQFPYWCWWGRYCLPPNRDASQNIAHGTAKTGSDGAFTVKFAALPDLSVPEKTEPTFTYTVYADVTDTTGETRSDSQSVRAGYAAISATIGADEWQTQDKPVEWTVGTTTLDGEPQAAEGTVKIYALKQPEKVVRSELASTTHYDYWWFRKSVGKNSEPKPDPANPDSWELAEVVAKQVFKTDATGQMKVTTPLKAGVYRAMVENQDRFGKAVTARRTLQVADVKAAKYPVRLANRFASPKWSVEPGETFVALWGTGYDTGRAYVELEHRGKLLRAFWTGEDRTQEIIEQAATEEMRGGFTIRLTYVRENRAYLENRVVDVPWSNKKFTVKWEHFTSKLEPGKKESWTAVVTGPDAKKAVAEMVATLYDASLDQYKPHNWMQGFNVFRRENTRVSAQFENSTAGFDHILGGWKQDYRSVEGLTYRHYPADITQNIWGYRDGPGRGGRGRFLEGDSAKPMKAKALMADRAPPAPTTAAFAAQERDEQLKRKDGVDKARLLRASEREGTGTADEPSGPDLSKVTARKNLNETAFFFPHLVSDTDGVVRMEFTMPEALTEWKFMGFAHDRDLRSGFLTDKTVTAKDLMVEPNPPRFVREGDVIEFTVKVSNQSAARQTGKVRLTFADARTLKDVTPALFADTRNLTPETSFDIPSKESKTYAWRVSIPDGCDFLTYKAVGATDRLSDGEEGYLPVLSRRILVTESLPLPIRGEQTKKFQFDKLMQSGKSKTLKNENLTVQMVSQPAWYAVMALPYLMETPYECSEAVFNRLYANSLAQFIANSNPKIRRIFDQWKNTPTLDSPLEKNQDLKSVMLEETPWLREAKDESQARRNVGILFDANRLDTETQNTFQKLAQMQLGDGLWPWFPGFRGDEYMTLYIATGFGRMRHLGAEKVDMAPALKSLAALDVWMDRMYRDILRTGNKDDNHLSSTVAFYLYGRSFFLKDRPIAKEHQEALDYWLGQAKKYWLQLGWRQSQGHLAIGLKRFGDAETPLAIMKSIKEFSVSNEEMGLFWRDTELSWWWYRAPIETQALMIEAFDEVVGDAQAVEDCKVWLLKQKQTQDWKTTKATADAVYGLLLRGTNLLASDALVEVSLGGETIKPEKVEAGTGFYEQKFVRGEIKPAMGKIEVKKTDAGVSWGSVHWQYLEDMSKITPYEGTPLKVKKTLYRKEATKKGQVLEPVKGALAVGDELVCRIEVRVDRDMEYVHLKDQRGSGTEPVNVLSQAKYQDGLMYYESTRDTASHFFIHYLPKGVYVFEYSVRVQLKGNYQSGIASIQCLYAPEFNSHSESFDLEVK